ncbi:TonB-dependent receptor plug domain-containing protein [Lacimicrobium alkaliphilum]|uniref:TonB-dependent receptor n=1 Tax=Lacimicrobium alkaliphilum TaxID=1526571 RepID=A0ABQ1RPP8_9ALTE|nr:TonB-dependent receptor [Lacimicrobium alkaliphilum]GGD75240.1 TonB-dependent receptor [Lacimicrobium alkaliphilum]
MKLTLLPLTFGALGLIGLSSDTFASQRHGDNIESLTVTGTRLQQNQLQTSTSMSRTQIERINPLNTLDLLKQIPNLLISRDGVAGRSHIAIRGGESNFTLVMIDGVTVNDPTNSSGGGFDFSQLDPAVIERIDVYRGGTSAIYGGEAVSGVIHFITRQSAANSLSVEAGSDKQQRGNLTLSTQSNQDLSALLSLSANQQQSSDFAEIQHQQALLKLGADTKNSEHQLLLSASNTDRLAFAEDSGGETFAIPREAESRDSKHALASWLSQFNSSDNLKWTSRISWTRTEEQTDNPGIAPGVIDGIPASLIESDYRKLDGEIYLNWQLSDTWSVLGGASGKKAIGENRGTLDFGFPMPVNFRLEQENYSAFMETSKRLDDLTLELGLRFDAPQSFNSELSSRLNLAWQLNSKTRLHAGYSEGYKLPSFFALAHPLVGNPELKPELSENSEIGIRVQGQSGYSVQMNLFYNKFEDLVDFDAELFTNVNRSEVHTSGIEWRGSGQLNEWLSASLDFAYLDIDVKDTDNHLRRRPKWSGGIQLNAQLDNFSITLSADSRGEFYDSSVPTGEILMNGYTEVALAAQWQLSEKLSLSLNLDNLLDKDFEQSVGFIDPGRQARAGIRYQM